MLHSQAGSVSACDMPRLACLGIVKCRDDSAIFPVLHRHAALEWLFTTPECALDMREGVVVPARHSLPWLTEAMLPRVQGGLRTGQGGG